MIKDAAIDHGDAHAGAIQSVLLPGNVAHHSRNIVIRCYCVWTVRAHINDIGMLLQPDQGLHWNAICRTIDAAEREFQTAAMRSQCRKVLRLGSLVELDDHAHRAIIIHRKASKVCGQLVPVAAAYCRLRCHRAKREEYRKKLKLEGPEPEW